MPPSHRWSGSGPRSPARRRRLCTARTWRGPSRSRSGRRARSPAARIPAISISSASSLELRSGAKPPSSPTAVDEAPLVQRALEVMEDLGAHPQRLAERAGADGHDHELLEVDAVVRVGAAVEHVHHRHRQHMGGLAAQVAPQRQPLLGGRRRGPRPERPRAARWRRGGTCWRCRRGRSASGRARPAPRRPGRGSQWRSRR